MTYSYKGHEYIVVDECRFKNPETRKWLDAVIYKRIDSPKLFVREKNEFYERFKPNKPLQ